MADLNVRVIGDARSYERTLKKTEVATGRWAKKMEQVSGGVALGGRGGFGTALGVTGFVAAATSAVNAASDMNEQMSKTGVVFGQSADAVKAWAGTTTEQMGLSQRAALDTVSSFGALLTPLGIIGPKAAEQSEKLTQLGADLASFYNTDVQSALDAVRSGLVGESEPLRKYGVLLSETRVQQQAMADTGKKSATQLTNQEKALARVEIILADTAQAQGDFARTSDDLANRTKVFNARLDDLKVALGQGLVPAVSGAVGAFNDLFDAMGRVNDFFKSHHLGFLTRGAKDLGIGKSIEDQAKAANAAAPGMAGPVRPAAAAATGAAKVAESTKKAAAATKAAAMSANELAARRNDWFDAMIGRRQFQLEGTPLRSQFEQLQEIQGLIIARINVTQDITRRLTLEDQLLSVQRQMQGVREQFAAEQVAHEQKMADLAAQRKQAAADRFQNTLDWLEFGLEKADATKSVKDNVAREKDIIAALKQRISVVGRNLDLQRKLFQHEQALKALTTKRQAAAATAPAPRVPASARSTSPRISNLDALNRFAGLAQFGGNTWQRGANVVVNQHFSAPTTDRHREARYMMVATRSVFDG